MLRTLAALTAALATTASAQSLDGLISAGQLGTVLASETLCDLTLDPAGIETWIAANVAADDLSFASQLQTQVMGQEYLQKDMTASARIAHCAAVRQTATTMGLIK
jgi:hypothetical protein